MWLEKHVCVNKVNVVHTVVDFPKNLINEIADESLICLLSCQHEQFFPIPNAANTYELAVLPNLVYPNIHNKKLTLHDFLENRILILQNVNRICKDVCLRAFNDLVVVSLFNTTPPPPPPPPLAPPAPPAPVIPAPVFVPHVRNNNVVSMDINKGKGVIIDQTPSSMIKIFEGFPKPNIIYDHSLMFGHGTKVQLYPSSRSRDGGSNSNTIGDNNFFPEDRTIFLTFSKDYPISEFELQDYFTRYIYVYVFLYIYMCVELVKLKFN